jgi:putative ABC transport system substrate-binding protein
MLNPTNWPSRPARHRRRFTVRVKSQVETAVRERAEAVVVQDALMATYVGRLPEFAAQSYLPVIYPSRRSVEAGGLMSYGPRPGESFRRAAYYVDRILKGTRPADLPVEQPREFDFVINLKTAQTLGFAIPQHVMLQATEVIQ